MASNLRVDNILPSSGVNLGIGTANGSVTFIGDTDISTTGSVTIAGNLGVGGTITYEDVARVDATGISTFREGFGVGPLTGIALTAYKDGSIRTSGIVTAASFDGSLATSNLTGTISTATSAATAYALDSAANITTGIVTATAFVPTVGQLGHRNLFNNGACLIGQRGSTSLTSGYGGVDRWVQFLSGGATTTSKDTSVPTGQGFTNSIKVDTTSALASGSSNWAWVGQYIEAQDVQSVCKGTSNAKQLTLQFWVKSPKTGTHTVRLDCQDSSDGVGATYSVSAADTWEKKTVTFPASTSGAINNDNGRGIQVLWVLSAGTNYSSGTLNTTWASWTNANAAPGQPNVLDSGSNNFYLTGVQLEVGSVATPFEHRRYSDELSMCQRYCQRYTSAGGARIAVGVIGDSTTGYATLPLKVTMRQTPTLSSNANGKMVKEGTAWYSVTSLTIGTSTPEIATLTCIGTHNMSALDPFTLGDGTDFVLNAEL